MSKKFKVIGGTIPASAELIKKDGQTVLKYGGLGNKTYVSLAGNIASIQPITEDNKKSIIGKAGWGVAGALALGGVGALAGVLAGGNKKEMLIAMEMKSGEKIVADVNSDTFKMLYGLYSTPSAIRHIQSSAEKAEIRNQKIEEWKKTQEEKIAHMTPEEKAAAKKKSNIELLVIGIIILAAIYFIFF